MTHASGIIETIPGQGSGISFKYFSMLAGNGNYVKPDRMVKRFVADALSIKQDDVSDDFAERLLISGQPLSERTFSI
jgi:hypothetical protein